MIDTNAITQAAQAAQAVPAVQQTLSAWNVVALGIGAAVTHAYHTVVAGGGLKNIARKFWNGSVTDTNKEDAK